eukprot:7118645-Ditylum_brightwellii.AAC.1
MEAKLTAQITALSMKMNKQTDQMNAYMKQMQQDIRSEMTKVIDNLTTNAISKIDTCMTTQFDAMNNN